MDEQKMQLLLDRMEIIDVENRYAMGVDTRDSELHGSCFAEELEVDMSGMGAGEPMTMPGKAWAEQAVSLVGMFLATQHMITNHRITIDGDRATCVAYVKAQHYNPDSIWTVVGTYTNELERTADGWKITKLKLTPTWQLTTKI
jgi:hypothetical protein